MEGEAKCRVDTRENGSVDLQSLITSPEEVNVELDGVEQSSARGDMRDKNSVMDLLTLLGHKGSRMIRT